jgi:hypothetical protein
MDMLFIDTPEGPAMTRGTLPDPLSRQTSLMTTERARTLSAHAVDEIASSYTLLNRILSELEETLVPPCLPHSPLLSVSLSSGLTD